MGGHDRMNLITGCDFILCPNTQQRCSLDKVKYNLGGKLYAVEILLNCAIDTFFSKYKKYLTFTECLAFVEDCSMHTICITAYNFS